MSSQLSGWRPTEPCAACGGEGTRPLLGAGRGVRIVCETCLGTGSRLVPLHKPPTTEEH